MTHVVVIGGGLSGLSTAFELKSLAPHARITILEATSRAGGPIRSSYDAGFVFDWGPSGFLNRDPSTLDIARRLGLGDEIITGCEQVRRRLIRRDGRLRHFPDSMSSFLQSDLLSARAKARMLMEPMLPRMQSREDESVGAFARRRLGREAADFLFDPVMSGIYAGCPDRLSIQATLPQLATLSSRGKSVLWSLLRRRVNEKGTAPATVGTVRYVSFKRGMGQLTESLVDALSSHIVYESPVERVERLTEGYRISVGGAYPRSIDANVVISAAPAPAAARFLSGLSREMDTLCACVPFAPVTVVALGFHEADVPHPLDAFGYLVPKCEEGSVLGVLWSSSIYPGHRSPEGKVLVRTIVGGERDPQICKEEEDTIVTRVRSELQRTLGIMAKPHFEGVARHARGLPQLRVGHNRRVARAEASLLHLPGLFVTGNSFRGIGVNACTSDAKRTAGGVATYLDMVAADSNKEDREVPLVSEATTHRGRATS